MAEFAGYEMPIQYSAIVPEHAATRSQAGLFDISHMGRLRFEGPRAHELLDHVLTRRVANMRPGMVRYSLVCNESGGILDDVLVSNLETPSGRQYFLLVVNASNRPKILKWLAPHLAEYPDIAFTDVTDSTAMLSVQGPASVPIVEQLFSASVTKLKYYRSLVTEQMSKPCIVSRTGYTGEDGFELIVRSEDAQRVWENLMLAGREYQLQPVGLGARDTLRLEAGMPLYGHELDEDIDPFTAGVGFAVNLQADGTDRQFVGADSLRARSQQQLATKRIGLKLVGRRAAREGAPVKDKAGNVLGKVTSGTFSPTLQCPIAMAYLDSDAAGTGKSVQAEVRGTRIDAEIVDLPFYRRPQ